ncbi:hypothetical protein [Yersinia frederiksenii]|uniref:hypothetical protein n=1 Tax=Yersinia frederiksenii TaxID=29484 RepID=UPI00005F911F|nr:hypothetical protein [Yersinia frederiksenii]EEQ12755.1 Fe2+/Zn2+ uptake regulation protein [Yersinia frederiksenii ATCC 33641]
MKPLKQCQRLIQFLALSAEKAAKSVGEQHNKRDVIHRLVVFGHKKGGLNMPPCKHENA